MNNPKAAAAVSPKANLPNPPVNTLSASLEAMNTPVMTPRPFRTFIFISCNLSLFPSAPALIASIA